MSMYGGAVLSRGEALSQYHAEDGYRSCSRVKTLLDSPTLYHQRYVTRTMPEKTSSAMEHGSLLHRWLEEGDAFLKSLTSPPESTLTSTGLVGKEAEKWIKNEAPEGAIVVSPKEEAQIRREVAAILENHAARNLIEQAIDHEVSVRWKHGIHKVKCRYDLATPDVWVDLKTTSVTDILRDFHESVIDFKYHLQDAWYQRGMAAADREPKPIHFIVISTAPPHACEVVTLPAEITAEGFRLMDRALAELRAREDLDWWHSETHGEVIELKFPDYIYRRFQK